MGGHRREWILYRRGTGSEALDCQSGPRSQLLSGNNRHSRTESSRAAPCWCLGLDDEEPLPGADREGRRTILGDGDAVFVLYRLAQRYGLPVLPEWAGWFRRALEERKAIQPLVGLGCDPVVVRGGKKALLHWIGKALKKGLIGFPAERGPIWWKLSPNFLEQIPGSILGNKRDGSFGNLYWLWGFAFLRQSDFLFTQLIPFSNQRGLSRAAVVLLEIGKSKLSLLD